MHKSVVIFNHTLNVSDNLIWYETTVAIQYNGEMRVKQISLHTCTEMVLAGFKREGEMGVGGGTKCGTRDHASNPCTATY